MSCIRFTFVALLLRLHCCSAYWSSSSLNKVPFRFLNYGKPTYPAAAFFSSNNNSNESNQKAEEKEEDWNPSSTTVTSNDRITYGFSQDSKNKKKKKYNTSGSSTERKKTAAAEFELQELRAQLKEMAQKNINSASLSLEKRQELEGYIQTVCETSTSPIPLGTLATTKPTPLLGLWRLVFSTEKATLSVLPKEATVYVNILTSPEADKDGTLEYSLKFAMGALREIKAISTYTIDVSKQHNLHPSMVKPYLFFYSLFL